MTMETQKEFDLQTYTRHEISVPFAMSTNLQNEIPHFPKKTNQTMPRQILGQNQPEKNSAKCFIRSGDIPSPRQTPMDKTNDCVMNSE